MESRGTLSAVLFSPSRDEVANVTADYGIFYEILATRMEERLTQTSAGSAIARAPEASVNTALRVPL